MFCYQCQETAGCKGCTVSGVCGKRPEVAALQDLLVYATKGLSSVTTALRKEGKDVAIDVNHMVTLNLFTTITNANFDEVSIRTRVTETLKKTAELRAQLQDVSGLSEAALWSAPETDYAAKAAEVGVLSESNEDIRSLKETITYGLKGLAAYLHHANVLNHEDEDVDAFIQRALSDIQKKDISVDGLVALTLETGKGIGYSVCIIAIGKGHIDSQTLDVIGGDLEAFIIAGVTVFAGCPVGLLNADGIGSHVLRGGNDMEPLGKRSVRDAAVHVIDNADITGRDPYRAYKQHNADERDNNGGCDTAERFSHF